MSSDQRPAKVRVFSSSGGMGDPGRRRDDNVARQTPSETAPDLPAAPVKSQGLGRMLVLAVLFLFGCAIGGGVIAWFGLAPGAPS